MARTLRVMDHACHRGMIFHALMTWRIPSRRRAPEGRCGTEGRRQARRRSRRRAGVGGVSSSSAQIGGGGAALDLGGERGVILGAAAGGGVLEDRLAEARALGQADVAADPGAGRPGRRPRGPSALRRPSKKRSRSSITSPPSRVPASYRQRTTPADLQVAVDPLRDQVDRLQQLRQPVQRQEVRLERDEDLAGGAEGVERQDARATAGSPSGRSRTARCRRRAGRGG